MLDVIVLRQRLIERLAREATAKQEIRASAWIWSGGSMKSAQHRPWWNHISMASQRVTRCIDPVLFELHDRKRVNLAVSHTGAAPVKRASERRNRYLTRARRNRGRTARRRPSANS